MTSPETIKNHHIGAAGELLVQYQLLKYGIDSARLTTDSGIDLVMYLPITGEAFTVQVKTKRQPVAAGGKGKPSLNWPIPVKDAITDCAQWLACVDLSRDAVWLFTIEQARWYGKQTPPLLYWFVGDGPAGALREDQMTAYRLETVAKQLVATGTTATVERG